MTVSAISPTTAPATAASVAQNKTLGQADFIRLMTTQMKLQDPLEPVDNREFLAQLAQFTSLEQSRQTSQNTTDLLAMTATTRSGSMRYTGSPMRSPEFSSGIGTLLPGSFIE